MLTLLQYLSFFCITALFTLDANVSLEPPAAQDRVAHMQGKREREKEKTSAVVWKKCKLICDCWEIKMQTEACYCAAAGLGKPAPCHGAVGIDGPHLTLPHYYQHLTLSPPRLCARPLPPYHNHLKQPMYSLSLTWSPAHYTGHMESVLPHFTAPEMEEMREVMLDGDCI